MADRRKGEVPLHVNDKTYTLVVDINTMARLEEHFSTPEKFVTWPQILLRLKSGSMTYGRAFFWAALQRYHADVTIEQAGELIQEAGGFDGVTEQIAALVSSTAPDPADLKDLNIKPPNPRKAQTKKRRGTGGGSTSTPDASV